MFSDALVNSVEINVKPWKGSTPEAKCAGLNSSNQVSFERAMRRPAAAAWKQRYLLAARGSEALLTLQMWKPPVNNAFSLAVLSSWICYCGRVHWFGVHLVAAFLNRVQSWRLCFRFVAVMRVLICGGWTCKVEASAIDDEDDNLVNVSCPAARRLHPISALLPSRASESLHMHFYYQAPRESRGIPRRRREWRQLS